MLIICIIVAAVVLAFFPTLRCAFFHSFALVW